MRTILIADLVMSLDNVIAVAAAAKDNNTLLIIGLAVSIPLIVFGPTLLMKVMDRFRSIIITLGAALLGFLAGEMFVTDPARQGFLRQTDRFPHVGWVRWGHHRGRDRTLRAVTSPPKMAAKNNK